MATDDNNQRETIRLSDISVVNVNTQNSNVTDDLSCIVSGGSDENSDHSDDDKDNEYIQDVADRIQSDKVLQQQTDSSALKDVLRAMPDRLTVKRKIKKETFRSSLPNSSVFNFNQQIRQLSYWKYFCYNVSILITKINLALYDLFTAFELWYESLRTIEGHFGSAIGTYFKFYRFLFLLNLIPLVLSFTFVILPQVFHRSSNNTSKVVSILSNLTQLESIIAVYDNSANNGSIDNEVIWRRSEENFEVYDLITAKGYFENSILFYGYYSNDTFNLGPFSYSMPKAYLYTTCCSYLLTLIILCVYTTKSYCDCFVKSKGEANHQFCLKVFAGCDFSIATETAARLHKEILFRELKELLNEQQCDVAKRTKCLEVASVFLIRFISNAVFVTAMYLIGWHSSHLLHFTNDAYRTVPDNSSISDHDHKQICLFTYVIKAIPGSYDTKRAVIYPIYISCCLVLVIRAVLWLIRYEKYNNPRTLLYVNMVRMFIVEMVIIYVFLKFWIDLRSYTEQCWETYIGQSTYQLLVIDFLLCTFVTSAYGIGLFGFRKLFEQQRVNMAASCKSLEFAIANNTFSLIHNQILFWTGFYFSPMLPFVITIFMFITFYVKKYSLLYIYSPPTRTWRTAQTQTFFLVLTFLSLLLIMSVHGYIIFNVQPSKKCGPFKGVDNQTYQEIFTKGSSYEKEDLNIWTVLLAVRKPGIVFGIFVILWVNMYFMRARSKTEIELVDTIRSILVLQGKDKQFLAQLLSEMMNGLTTTDETHFDSDTLIEAISKEDEDKESRAKESQEQHESSVRNNLLLSQLIKTHRTNRHADNPRNAYLLNAPTSILVEGLRGIPGSPRTARFAPELKRGRYENRKTLTTFITQHKTGLFV